MDKSLFPLGEATCQDGIDGGVASPEGGATSSNPGTSSSSSSVLGVGVPGAEMFTIAGAHRTAVTALEWSRNGMRLFSGDAEGQVSFFFFFFFQLGKSLLVHQIDR